MDFERSHLEKIKLWPVEHFWLTFFPDLHWSGKKVSQKCSTGQSIIFPKWNSFKIGTLVLLSKIEEIDTFKATNLHQNGVKTNLKSITNMMHYII